MSDLSLPGNAVKHAGSVVSIVYACISGVLGYYVHRLDAQIAKIESDVRQIVAIDEWVKINQTFIGDLAKIQREQAALLVKHDTWIEELMRIRREEREARIRQQNQ